MNSATRPHEPRHPTPEPPLCGRQANHRPHPPASSLRGDGQRQIGRRPGRRAGRRAARVFRRRLLGWLPGWQERTVEEQRAIAAAIAARDCWALDSADGGRRDVVLPRAELAAASTIRAAFAGPAGTPLAARGRDPGTGLQRQLRRPLRGSSSDDSIIRRHFRSFRRKRQVMRGLRSRIPACRLRSCSAVPGSSTPGLPGCRRGHRRAGPNRPTGRKPLTAATADGGVRWAHGFAQAPECSERLNVLPCSGR